MNRKQKIIVSITGIFIVLLALVGLTYAYFLTQITGNENDKSISVTTANLQLSYEDDTNQVVTEERLMPSDTVYTKSFTVKNEGNANIDYGVYLINVINTFERKDDIKYTMECTTDGTLPCGAVASETTFPSGISELSTATIEPQKTHTYTFKFTYKDSGTDQSVDMNKELQAKIQIFAPNKDGEYYPFEEGTLAYNIINNAINKKNGTQFVNTPPTKIAEQISSDNWDLAVEESVYYDDEYVDGYAEKDIIYSCIDEGENCDAITDYTSCTDDVKGKYVYGFDDMSTLKVQYVSDCENGKILIGKLKHEKVLSTTQDNYGTSYYFRGNVKDNYVTFSGMCWRIVRVQGDGSIKLTLESQSPCSKTMTSNFSIGMSDWGYYEGEDYNYIGDYTYGMKYLLTSWLNETNDNGERVNITTKAENLLKNEEWCLGNVTDIYNYNSPFGLLGTTALENYSSRAQFYFKTGRNLAGKGVTPNATLVCNGEADISKIGALTADEVVFAGGKVYEENYNYYLQNDDYWWWTLSRGYYSDSRDYVFYMDANGKVNLDEITYSIVYVRPAVSLNTGVKILSGEGTKENPYIINEG